MSLLNGECFLRYDLNDNNNDILNLIASDLISHPIEIPTKHQIQWYFVIRKQLKIQTQI